MRITLILISIHISILVNAQLVWSPIETVTTANGVNRPRVVLNSSGNPLVIWGENSKLMYSFQSGSGMTSAIQLNPQNSDIAEAFWQGPEIAAKGDTVYIVYKTIPETDSSKHIYCLSSFDGGISFNQPIRVDYIGNTMSRFPVVAINDSGHPIIAFMKSDINYHNPQWVVVTSSDYGQSFSSEVQVSGFNSINAEACDCCPSSIKAKGNMIVVGYRDNDSDIRDTWLGVSINGGNSFYNTRVDTSNWYIQACPSSGPDIEIYKDTVFTTFMSGVNQTRSYLSKYSLNDSILSIIPLQPSNEYQNYPRLSKNESNIAIVWKSISGSKQRVKMNLFEGGNAHIYELDSGIVNVPDIAVKDQNICVAWHNNFTKSIMLKQATIGYIGIEEHQKSEVKVFPNPTKDRISITSDQKIIEVKMFDIGGNLITRKSDSFDSFDLSNLQKGVYLMKVSLQSKVVVIKILLQ